MRDWEDHSGFINMICKFQENKGVVTRRKDLAVINRNRQGAGITPLGTGRTIEES